MFALFEGLLVLFLFILSVFLVILFHELGHALMVMKFTTGNVNIYIGSHGDPDHSTKIRTGRLVTHIKYNPLKWARGRCVPPAEQISTNQQILFIAAGPLMSIISGLLALILMKHLNPGIIHSVLLYFGLQSVIIGIFNFLPRVQFKRAVNGKAITTDGYKLVQLFRLKSLPPKYAAATELIKEKRYLEASEILQTLIDTGNKNKHVLRLSIGASLQAKDFQRGHDLMGIFMKAHLPNSDDYCNAGLIETMLKDDETALILYKKALALNSNNVLALNNIGHSLIELGRYTEAIFYLYAAISESPKFCYARSNLGRAKILLGDLDGGFEAIQDCLKIDANFADAHTCLGIYYMTKGNLTDANKSFERSKELGSEDLSNDNYLKEIKVILSKSFL